MIYAVLKTLHLLSIVVWVGGMVFAHFFLRPALAQLEPPARLRLMHEVLGRFFRAVLVASLLALASGIWMIGRVAKQLVQSGGRFEMQVELDGDVAGAGQPVDQGRLEGQERDDLQLRVRLERVQLLPTRAHHQRVCILSELQGRRGGLPPEGCRQHHGQCLLLLSMSLGSNGGP